MKNQRREAANASLADLDKGRLRDAIAIACQIHGPWPAGFSHNSDRPHFEFDQIIKVLEAPHLPVRRPPRLPHRTRENLQDLSWSETGNVQLFGDDESMLQFTEREIDIALAGVCIVWLIRDFVALGLQADARPKRAIAQIQSEKKQVARLVGVIRQWSHALETQILREAWRAERVTFDKRRGVAGFEAFRATTEQLGAALALSLEMLEAELLWQRTLDDDPKGSARVCFIRDSVAPCFNDIYDHSVRGESKGIWRPHNAAAVRQSLKRTAQGSFILFAFEVLKVLGVETAPNTIADALGGVRVKKRRVKKQTDPAEESKESQGSKEPEETEPAPRSLKPSTLLSKLKALLAEPAVQNSWSNWHSIFGRKSKLGAMDAYSATLERLAQHKLLQRLPRK